MDRRRFLGIAGAGAASYAVARRLGIGELPGAGAASPTVTPFTATLTVPPTAVPTSTSGGIDVYEIAMRTASASILPGLQTEVYGYDGRFPGPTIRAEVGRPVHVTFVNDLPVPTAIHLHGGNVAAGDDGHPLDVIDPGDRRLYTYPNQQLAATYWYHDHAMDHTAENVYRGLAGLYLLHDPKDDVLGLPSGERDVPLLLQDRAFHSDGSLDYPSMSDPRSHNGVTGDVFLVNGVPSPKLAVERGRYRFRIVNGSNTRQYDLRLDGGASMVQVASDGGLLGGPVPVTHVPLGVAERAEIVVDFSIIDPGTPITMVDANSGTGIVRFDVGSSGSAGTAPPSTLRSISPITGATVTRDVHLSFDDARQEWVINGQPFDPARIDFRPRLGVAEQWRITNGSTFVHPFHLHLTQFQVLKRNLANPPAGERGWKDTVRVGPKEEVLLAARFTGHTGTYVFHCHVLEHEEHSMMGQVRVVDLARVAGPDRAATAAAISARAFPNGANDVFVATGDSFADALAAGPAAAAVGGPILLVRGGALSPATRDELTRLAPKRITVVGGPGAVAESVVDELRSHAPVTRVAGSDRYATAAAVARLVTSPPVVFVATGAGFADALVGGAAVAALKGALLLTERDRLPQVTADALRAMKPGTIVVLGGTGAVSGAVESQLRALGIGTVERRAGADRYETARAINAKVFPGTVPAAFVATGTSFGDALAATPAAAAAGAAVVLTDPASLPPPARADLARLAPARIVVVGGTAAVSSAAEDELATIL